MDDDLEPDHASLHDGVGASPPALFRSGMPSSGRRTPSRHDSAGTSRDGDGDSGGSESEFNRDEANISVHAMHDDRPPPARAEQSGAVPHTQPFTDAVGGVLGGLTGLLVTLESRIHKVETGWEQSNHHIQRLIEAMGWNEEEEDEDDEWTFRADPQARARPHAGEAGPSAGHGGRRRVSYASVGDGDGATAPQPARAESETALSPVIEVKVAAQVHGADSAASSQPTEAPPPETTTGRGAVPPAVARKSWWPPGSAGPGGAAQRPLTAADLQRPHSVRQMQRQIVMLQRDRLAMGEVPDRTAVEALQQRVQELERQLQERDQQSSQTQQSLEALARDVRAVNDTARQAAERADQATTKAREALFDLGEMATSRGPAVDPALAGRVAGLEQELAGMREALRAAGAAAEQAKEECWESKNAMKALKDAVAAQLSSAAAAASASSSGSVSASTLAPLREALTGHTERLARIEGTLARKMNVDQAVAKPEHAQEMQAVRDMLKQATDRVLAQCAPAQDVAKLIAQTGQLEQSNRMLASSASTSTQRLVAAEEVATDLRSRMELMADDISKFQRATARYMEQRRVLDVASDEKLRQLDTVIAARKAMEGTADELAKKVNELTEGVQELRGGKAEVAAVEAKLKALRTELMQHAIEVAAPKADRVSVAKDVADAVGPKADKKYVDDVVRMLRKQVEALLEEIGAIRDADILGSLEASKREQQHFVMGLFDRVESRMRSMDKSKAVERLTKMVEDKAEDRNVREMFEYLEREMERIALPATLAPAAVEQLRRELRSRVKVMRGEVANAVREAAAAAAAVPAAGGAPEEQSAMAGTRCLSCNQGIPRVTDKQSPIHRTGVHPAVGSPSGGGYTLPKVMQGRRLTNRAGLRPLLNGTLGEQEAAGAQEAAGSQWADLASPPRHVRSAAGPRASASEPVLQSGMRAHPVVSVPPLDPLLPPAASAREAEGFDAPSPTTLLLRQSPEAAGSPAEFLPPSPPPSVPVLRPRAKCKPARGKEAGGEGGGGAGARGGAGPGSTFRPLRRMVQGTDGRMYQAGGRGAAQ